MSRLSHRPGLGPTQPLDLVMLEYVAPTIVHVRVVDGAIQSGDELPGVDRYWGEMRKGSRREPLISFLGPVQYCSVPLLSQLNGIFVAPEAV